MMIHRAHRVLRVVARGIAAALEDRPDYKDLGFAIAIIDPADRFVASTHSPNVTADMAAGMLEAAVTDKRTLANDNVREPADLLDEIADEVMTILVEKGDRALAGTVLTMCLGRVLATLDDETAEKASEMHARQSMELRAAYLAAADGMTLQ